MKTKIQPKKCYKKKPPKKKSKQQLLAIERRKRLASWSKEVRNRDGNACVVCLATTNLNSHHILPKEYYKEIQYDINVGICLCVKHHKWSKYSAHKNGIWFSTWLQNNRPKQYKWIMEQI